MQVDTVVLLGLGANGLGNLRALARGGIRTVAIDNDPRKPGARSRYGEKVILTHHADIRDAYREALQQLARRPWPRAPLLLPSNDEAVEVLHADRERLSASFRLLVPPAATVERLSDKLAFDRAARDAGIDAPRTWLLSDEDRPRNGDWVLKPRRRYSRSGVRLEAPRLLRSANAPDGWIDRLRGEPDEYVLQERIEGDDDRLEFYGACWQDGRPVAEFTGAKLRQYPRGSGSTSCARLTRGTEIRELSRRLLEQLDYEGCADVEFKRAADGRYHVIEVNARTALWHVLGELAGISLPLVACDVASGRPFQPELPARIGSKWIYLERDLRAARDRSRAGDPGWSRFWRDLAGVRRCAVLSLRDPVPFLTSVVRIVARRSERRNRTLAAPTPSAGKASVP